MATPAEGSSRARPTLLLALAGVLLLGRMVAEAHDASHPPRIRDPIAWRAPSQAVTDGKRPVLYLFTADWCAPCRMLEHDVLLDPDGARLIRASFLPVKVVDRRQEEGANGPAEAALIKRFAVDGFPTLVVDRPGRPAARLDGYTGREAALGFLRSAAAP
jgi:thiol:disulfide interchange protein